MKMKTKKKGFTLIELLVCLFIIGLMMLLIIPNIAQQRQSAQEKSDEAIVRVVKSQQHSMHSSISRWASLRLWATISVMRPCASQSIFVSGVSNSMAPRFFRAASSA